MYPDLKFMNANDDLIFAPLETHNTLNNGLFISEEFIEEFRTSSISENPLNFDFREIILSSDITNKDEELKDLITAYENDSRITKDLLKSYNLNSSELTSNSINIPLECDILRELDLDIDEEVLELERNFEDDYELETRYPNKCNNEVIFNKILKSNPRIIQVLQSYRIPFPVAKTLMKQIIGLTINYCNNQSTPFPIKPLPGQHIGIDNSLISPYIKNTNGENND